MKKIRVEIEWENFKILAAKVDLFEDDILKKQYVCPKFFSLKEIFSAISVNTKIDFLRYVSPALNRINTAISYKLESYEVRVKQGKRVVMAVFAVLVINAAVNPPDFLVGNSACVPAKKEVASIAPVKKAVIPVKKASKNLVGTSNFKIKPTTTVSSKDTILTLQAIEQKVNKYAATITLNTFDAAKWNGKKVTDLPSPLLNKLNKFSTYENAVLYFYWLGKFYNRMNPTKTINVRGWMAQIGIEAGLRPANGGMLSGLATYVNNPHGGKTFEKNAPHIKAKDDEYVQGKLVHSRFKIFPSYYDAIKDYADVIHAARYMGKEQIDYVRKANGVTKVTILYNSIAPYKNSKLWYKYIHGLRVSGYCTADEGVYESQCSVTYLEQGRVLKKHGIYE